MPEWRALVLAAALCLGGCSGAVEPHVRERLLIWNTEAVVDVVGVPAERARAAIASANTELQAMAAAWHAWKPSELTRINAALARGESVAASASVLAMIERAQPLLRRSQRLFDPGIGGLVEMWGFHTDDYPIRTPVPGSRALEEWLAQRPSLADLEIESGRLHSANPRLQLDFGAIGEGAAIERTVQILDAAGIDHALIALGGDLYARGDAGAAPWRVAIEDPITGEGELAALDLGDREGLFVSGNYARYRFSPSGERWSHVLDPRTGRPSTGVALSAVVADDPVLGDAASTVLMIGGPARFAELMQRLEVRCALLLTDQNELMISRAMLDRIELRRRPVPLGEPIGEAAACGS